MGPAASEPALPPGRAALNRCNYSFQLKPFNWALTGLVSLFFPPTFYSTGASALYYLQNKIQDVSQKKDVS